jgi:hypothetical protein
VGNVAHPGQPEIAILLNEVVAGGAFVHAGNGDIAWQESHAGVALADHDLDGDLDAFVTTVYPGDSGRLHDNRGDATFVDVTADQGLAGQDQGYAVAWSDVDDDGTADLWLGGQQSAHLFLNQAQGHWLSVRLRGDGERVNAAAIGARITAHAGELVVVREVQAEGGERGGNDLELHMGVGAHDGPIVLEVAWPWAERCTYDATTDEHIEITYTPDCDEDPPGEDTGEASDDDATASGDADEGTESGTSAGAAAGPADPSGCACVITRQPLAVWAWLALMLPIVRRGRTGRRARVPARAAARPPDPN